MSNSVRFGLGMWPDDPFWVQVIDAIHQRSTEHGAELIPITRSTFSAALTPDEKNALLEDIISQELDVLLGWCFPAADIYLRRNLRDLEVQEPTN